MRSRSGAQAQHTRNAGAACLLPTTEFRSRRTPPARVRAVASYAASRPRLEPGRFVHMNLAWVNEECVQVIALDEVSQTFTAVVAQKHAASEPVRPVIWLARVPWQGNHQALYIVVEALPAPGSEVTLVI